MGKEWKPSLKQLLRKLIFEGNKQKFYEIDSVKYFENPNTKLVSKIILYSGVIILSLPLPDILKEFGIFGFIEVPLYIMYGIMMAFFLEIIHWIYAKYDKQKD